MLECSAVSFESSFSVQSAILALAALSSANTFASNITMNHTELLQAIMNLKRACKTTDRAAQHFLTASPPMRRRSWRPTVCKLHPSSHRYFSTEWAHANVSRISISTSTVCVMHDICTTGSCAILHPGVHSQSGQDDEATIASAAAGWASRSNPPIGGFGARMWSDMQLVCHQSSGIEWPQAWVRG